MLRSRLLPGTRSDLPSYLAVGGYGALTQARLDPGTLRTSLTGTALTGLGGGHFPFSRKLTDVLAQPGDRVVVCNAAEDEPGSRKDRTLLELNPHLVVEGALLAAAALDARTIYFYVGEELDEALTSLRDALTELREVPGVLDGLSVDVVHAPPTYVAGEATAVVRALQGEPATPAADRSYPSRHGVFGRPTLISNCETLANLPRIAAGHDTGTRLVSVTGDVADEGVYEVQPQQTTFGDLIVLAGGLTGSRPVLKAIQPGGPSSAYLDASADRVLMTDDAIRAAGSEPGCLAVRVLSEERCLVEELADLTAFFAAEQCGQCPACRMKTQAYAVAVGKIQAGKAAWSVLDQIATVDDFVADLPRRCSLISMPTPPVTSAVQLFRTDFAAHIDCASCSAAR